MDIWVVYSLYHDDDHHRRLSECDIEGVFDTENKALEGIKMVKRKYIKQNPDDSDESDEELTNKQLERKFNKRREGYYVPNRVEINIKKLTIS